MPSSDSVFFDVSINLEEFGSDATELLAFAGLIARLGSLLEDGQVTLHAFWYQGLNHAEYEVLALEGLGVSAHFADGPLKTLFTLEGIEVDVENSLDF